MLSPSGAVIPLGANTHSKSFSQQDASNVFVHNVFPILEFEVFRAWPAFVYCSVDRCVQCLMVSPYFRRRKSSLQKSNKQRTPSWVDLETNREMNSFDNHLSTRSIKCFHVYISQAVSDLWKCVSFWVERGEKSTTTQVSLPSSSKTRRV